MSAAPRHTGLRLVGSVLIAWGIVNVAAGVIIGLFLLTGNFYEGYNRGVNLVGFVPIFLGLINGIPPLVFGKIVHLLTEVEQNTRAAAEAAQAMIKHSEWLVKSTETVMRNTELAVKNTEVALRSALPSSGSEGSSAEPLPSANPS
ncbi:MAG: hypothetical protein ACK4WM_07870 [Thermoflexales bacterium]